MPANDKALIIKIVYALEVTARPTGAQLNCARFRFVLSPGSESYGGPELGLSDNASFDRLGPRLAPLRRTRLNTILGSKTGARAGPKTIEVIRGPIKLIYELYEIRADSNVTLRYDPNCPSNLALLLWLLGCYFRLIL